MTMQLGLPAAFTTTPDTWQTHSSAVMVSDRASRRIATTRVAMTNPPHVGSHSITACPTKGLRLRENRQVCVSLKPPNLHRLHNLVGDGKSAEPRRPLVGRQNTRCCQANHKKIALWCGAAGDGRCTLRCTEHIEQIPSDLKVRFPGGAIRALGIDHSLGATLLGVGLFCQRWTLREHLVPRIFANSLLANMLLRRIAIYQNVSASLNQRYRVSPFVATHSDRATRLHPTSACNRRLGQQLTASLIEVSTHSTGSEQTVNNSVAGRISNR